MTSIYWAEFKYKQDCYQLAAVDGKVCYIGGPEEGYEALEKWAARYVPGAVMIESPEQMQPFINEFEDYFSGQKRIFDMPIEPKGTDFQQEVWQALLEIPYGETRTYADIAARVGRPKAFRAVGTAIGANPLLVVVPCHRVIAKDGGLGGFSAGLDVKRALHAVEGISLRA
ncbi:methylated-DNA-[protein]-cysteine S-methyltransferase [Jeotgalibacillus alimentarius]|uniref:methylated-DNA--[protein]-cysteine S-methyltransferase n=1 Tax=Jeotgalibacillus alimentarius TaxID=135826 RepID=A0A0C2SBK8_9BACL|nr:methylated-DNA--[protein]-cysteine S-methyltransferase [Jeotgalibacillus alimentarius]KIL51349.1 methylated-DNA-[protein]-cysteine S-methyltransferase [Jeotgalibacillus alimentarius]